MAYGTLKSDVMQSSTAGTPPQFNDGNGTQVGTLCRAWVNFNGTGTVAIRASFNVSSITDNGTGDYTVNFTNALPDANYAAEITGTVDIASTSFQYFAGISASSGAASTKSTTQLRVASLKYNGTYVDSEQMNVAVFR